MKHEYLNAIHSLAAFCEREGLVWGVYCTKKDGELVYDIETHGPAHFDKRFVSGCKDLRIGVERILNWPNLKPEPFVEDECQ